MSNHPANEQLSAYLDGELEDAEAASVEAALQADAELQAELERLKGVQRLLRTHGPARAPAGFAARVVSAAAQEDTVVAGPWWRRPFGIPVEGVLVAAAAALVLVVALPRDEALVEPPVAPAAAVEDKAPAQDKGEGLVDANPDADEGVADEGSYDDAVADANEPEAAQGYGAKENSTTAPPPAAAKKGQASGDQELAKVEENQGGTADPKGLAGGMDNAATPVEAGAAEGSGVEDPQMAASGLAVELYSEDEGVLGTLQALVARHGGVIRDGSGRVVQTGLLEPGETRLFFDVPASSVSAMNKALVQLGATIEATNPTITGGGSFKVPVRIVITASGPSTPPQAAPNAARKQRMEADSYDAELSEEP